MEPVAPLEGRRARKTGDDGQKCPTLSILLSFYHPSHHYLLSNVYRCQRKNASPGEHPHCVICLVVHI